LREGEPERAIGHAGLSTTSAYLRGDRDRRHAAMERLFRKEGTIPKL